MENKKAPKRLVEIPHMRDPYTKHFLNDDGSRTAEIHLGTVHYKNENDQYSDISLELFDEDEFDQIAFPVTKEKKASFHARREIVAGLREKAKGGAVSREDSAFHGLKVPFDATIPKQFKKGYSMGKGSSRLTFKPEGANSVKGEKISSNEVKYAGAWEQTDVILELKDTGIKETIILQDPSAPSIFSFEVTGPLQDDLSADGLQVEKAWLVDAAGERRDVQTNVRRQGARTFLDLVADVYGLQYPIEIDPTVSLQPDASAGKDSYGWSGGPANTYGDIVSFRVGKESGGAAYETYIEFNLSSIPAGSATTSAILNLYVQARDAAEIHTRITPISAAWVENTVSWNTKPTRSTPLDPNVVFTSFQSSGTWAAIPVTNTVNAWTSGQLTNYGMVLDDASANNGNVRTFYSSDFATDTTLRPKLEVTYNTAPGVPVVTAPNGGEIWDATHTITWTAAMDESTSYSVDGLSTGTIGYGAVNAKVGQVFSIVNSTSKIKVRIPLSHSLASGDFKISLYNTDGTKPTTRIAANTFVPLVGKKTYETEFSYSFVAGQKYAIVVEDSTTQSAVTYYTTSNNPYSGGIQYLYPGTWDPYSNYDLVMEIAELISSNLQYHIQISTNNGSSWSDLVTLTAAGATSTTFDFSPVAATTTAKIRIRAYDGTSYGAWDESDAVFTIKHNTAPNKPTASSLIGTLAAPAIASTLTPTVTWNFSDPDTGDSQQSYQVLVYDTGGVLKHDSGQVVSSGNYHTLPSVPLLWKTKYYWRVRVWDTKGGAVSPYSDDQYFLTNQGPTANITNPSATSGVGTIYNDTLQPTFTWSYSDGDGDFQKSVQIQIKDGAATVFDSGEIVTTGTTYQIPGSAGLVYDKTYTTQIRARDINDTWGAYSALKYFHLNRSPGVPTNLSPAGTSSAPQVINDNLQPMLSWNFSDPDATDTEAEKNVMIFDATNGDTVWDFTSATPGMSQVFAGVLISGKSYYWKVRTKDQHGAWGQFSTNQYFYTNAKPNTPINQTPAGGSAAAAVAIYDDLTPLLSWTFTDPNGGDAQKAFQVRLYNEAGTLLHDSGEITSSAGSYEIPQAYKLTYSQKYQWEVRTKDPYDVWSNFTSRGWITPKVGIPSGLSAQADNFGAKIILDWTDSLAEALQGYNVYRATAAAGPYTKINGALVTQSQYSDSQVSTGVTYYYKVEAYVTAEEISPLSNMASAAAIFNAWYIGDFKFIGPSSMKGKRSRAQSKRTVLGQNKKVVQDRGFMGETLSLEIFLGRDEYSSGKQKFDTLMVELAKTEALSVRDPFGQVWKVAPGDVDWDLVPGSGELTYKVSVPLEEVN